MWRTLHGIMGVAASLGIIILALSGIFLAYQPIITSPGISQNLGAVLQQILQNAPDIEIDHIERTVSGQILIHHFAEGVMRSDIVDLTNGLIFPKPQPSELLTFFQTIHRDFFLGRPGRLISGLLGLILAVLCLSGAFLMVRRAGGIRNLFAAVPGRKLARWHVITGQITLFPLTIMALTAIWMSLVTFQLISIDSKHIPALPESSKAETIPAITSFSIFSDYQIADITKLTFPIPGDWFDVFVLETDAHKLIIDQSNGTILRTDPLPWLYRLDRWIYRLHSGEGLQIWAVVLALSALMIPGFTLTGSWLLVNRTRQALRQGIPGDMSKTRIMILVGSENGSTWLFAKCLRHALHGVGLPSAIASLNKLEKIGAQIQTLLILSATYGDGAPPANAQNALAALKSLPRQLDYAVLGFGDRQFPYYCAFAKQIDTAMARKNHRRLLPLDCINRQSVQTFQHWVNDLGNLFDLPLSPDLAQITSQKKWQNLIIHRINHFEDAKGITAHIQLQHEKGKKLRFQPGDLVEIAPSGAIVPRLYSIASPPGKSTLDLYVREHKQGQCSPILCHLNPGEKVHYILKSHDSFRMPRKGSVIMIAVGTGIAPFLSMIEAEKDRQRLTLFWGLRNRAQDFPFKPTLLRWSQMDGLDFYPAFSSDIPKNYVTDALDRQADQLRQQITNGASILFCGSKPAAQSIATSLSRILSKTSWTLAQLRTEKRYIEDIF